MSNESFKEKLKSIRFGGQGMSVPHSYKAADQRAKKPEPKNSE